MFTWYSSMNEILDKFTCTNKCKCHTKCHHRQTSDDVHMQHIILLSYKTTQITWSLVWWPVCERFEHQSLCGGSLFLVSYNHLIHLCTRWPTGQWPVLKTVTDRWVTKPMIRVVTLFCQYMLEWDQTENCLLMTYSIVRVKCYTDNKVDKKLG